MADDAGRRRRRLGSRFRRHRQERFGDKKIRKKSHVEELLGALKDDEEEEEEEEEVEENVEEYENEEIDISEEFSEK